ncbi:hypothetical protein SRHO_G00157420 [Serrasalmus rhombeus]
MQCTQDTPCSEARLLMSNRGEDYNVTYSSSPPLSIPSLLSRASQPACQVPDAHSRWQSGRQCAGGCGLAVLASALREGPGLLRRESGLTKQHSLGSVGLSCCHGAPCAKEEHCGRRLLTCSRCLLTAIHMAHAPGDRVTSQGKGVGLR